jgi:hypothetical protein
MEKQLKKLPAGIQTFEEIIKDEPVDKKDSLL